MVAVIARVAPDHDFYCSRALATLARCGFAASLPSMISGRFTFASNQALERTADRRDILLSMTSTLKPEAEHALVSGRSAFSR